MTNATTERSTHPYIVVTLHLLPERCQMNASDWELVYLTEGTIGWGMVERSAVAPLICHGWLA